LKHYVRTSATRWLWINEWLLGPQNSDFIAVLRKYETVEGTNAVRPYSCGTSVNGFFAPLEKGYTIS
jgi:hypothetical protein